MIFSSLAALFVGLSTPLTTHGIATPHFTLGPRALSPLTTPPTPLRIMPLGASITYGQASTTGCGYRCPLRSQLLSSGNTPVNFVGSRQHGPAATPDLDVEGWPGFRIDQVHAKASSIVARTRPNLVLINAGTNDAVQNRNVTSAGDRMAALIDDVLTWSPRATVVLSTLLVNRNPATERNVRRINEQLAAVAAAMQAAGRRVWLVDMHDGAEGAPVLGDLADDTHPNDAGYAKMANVWLAGLVRVADLGWLQAPEAVAGLSDQGEA
ncbi:family 3 putative carbohydrate esterase [Podospora conica]|nr:family 3 putative carbohydrate esterase [Schizothecium conicum]